MVEEQEIDERDRTLSDYIRISWCGFHKFLEN